MHCRPGFGLHTRFVGWAVGALLETARYLTSFQKHDKKFLKLHNILK